jgi:Domain of unknown function (DUF397)
VTNLFGLWRRSSYCANNSCVEVEFSSDQVAVRDSKDQHGPVLLFTRNEWDAFLKGARSGEFDLQLQTET